jgi:phytanoyl-CoA hydroxylase
MLGQNEIRQYEEDGYLVVEGVLADSELGELREASEALQEARLLAGGGDGLAVIQDIVFKGEAFMRAARHPRMLAAVADLIGPNLQMQHCKLNWKPAAVGKGQVDWHQDFPYFPHTNFDMLAVMLVLDDATPENGCMRVVPGSHIRGRSETDYSCLLAGPEIDTADYSPRPPVDLVVRAGGMTIHHCLAVHSSYPNTAGTPRRGLVYQIRAADAVQLGGNVYRCSGIQLLVEDPMAARCVPGVFRLPRHLVNRGGIPIED